MRWDKTDRILKTALPKLISEFDEIRNLTEDYVEILHLETNNLYSTAPKSVRSRVDRMVKKLKEKGKYEGFDAKYIESLRISDYRLIDALEILVLGAFLDSSVYDIAKDVFMDVAEDISRQANDEMPFRTDKPDWETLYPLTVVPTTALTFDHYVNLLNLTNTQDITKAIIPGIQSGLPIDYDSLFTKLRKRVLNINENKYSGVLHDTSISVGNQVYLAPLKESNHRVKFCAVMDNKTTEMCVSLNGQIFNTTEKNTFKRYFQSTGMTEVTVNGLVPGVNLPPITDFTHHCRSWIEFVD